MKSSQLIFLISLPRSGSTLLQKILGSHKKIETTSEPWLMLPWFSMFRKGAIASDYNHELAKLGITNFLNNAPGKAGQEALSVYYDVCAKMSLDLYSSFIKSDDAFFLDKTPRNYMVFDELYKSFPDAKFIILYRNPLAVFSSIIDTWGQDDLTSLSSYRVDLRSGIDFLERDFSSHNRVVKVKYENLVSLPNQTLDKLCTFLGVETDLSTLNYTLGDKWLMGDQTNIHKNRKPTDQYLSKWKEGLSDPKKYFLIKSFFKIIEGAKLDSMEYEINPDVFENTAFDELDTVQVNEYSDLWTLLYGDSDWIQSSSDLYANTRINSQKKDLDRCHEKLEKIDVRLKAKNKKISTLEAESDFQLRKFNDKANDLANRLSKGNQKIIELKAELESLKNNT